MKDVMHLVSQLEQLSEKATPGPWFSVKGYEGLGYCDSTHVSREVIVKDVNAQFIAASREAIPELCRAVREMNSLLNGLLNKVNKVTAYHRGGQTVSAAFLDELSNRQIEVENGLDKLMGRK